MDHNLQEGQRWLAQAAEAAQLTQEVIARVGLWFAGQPGDG